MCHARLLYHGLSKFSIVYYVILQNTLQVDYEMALDYATQAGVNEEPREDIHIPPLEAEYEYTEFFSPVFVFRLIH